MCVYGGCRLGVCDKSPTLDFDLFVDSFFMVHTHTHARTCVRACVRVYVVRVR